MQATLLTKGRVRGQILGVMSVQPMEHGRSYVRDGAIEALQKHAGPVLSKYLWQQVEVANKLDGNSHVTTL